MSRQGTPDFDDLIGREVAPAERARLHGVHELLLRAGPPPELSPELEQVPWPEEALAPLGLVRMPSRQGKPRPWLVYATAAAALLLVGFLVGQLGGSNGSSFETQRTVKMHGVGNVSNAAAVIEVGRAGADRNWPMVVSVSNLPPVPNGGYYDLWLSKHGKPLFLCGSFNTRNNTDTVLRLSAAYPLNAGNFDGWVVTQHVTGRPKGHARRS
jgi:Anti-sigma-K factor rskA